MFRPLVALLAACVLALPGVAAAQFFGLGHGLGFRHGPPGGGAAPSIPVLVPGAGWTGVTTPTGPFGSSSDLGYSDLPVAMFDAVQYDLVNSTTRYFEIKAKHQPTATDYAAGNTSNICRVKVAVDGAAWTTIAAPTVDPATGETGYVFGLNDSGTSDQVHEVRAIVEPCTGPSLVLQGPAMASTISTFASTTTSQTGAINNNSTGAGNILTTTGGTGFAAGEQVWGFGVAANTYIDGDSTTNPTACVAQTGANCTGTATAAGKFHVNVSQLVAAEQMEANRAPSFYYLTNSGGGLKINTYYVSSGGLDTSSGLTTALPKLTVASARSAAATAAGSGTYGAFICAQGAYTDTVTTTGSGLANLKGWMWVQPDTDWPCTSVGPSSLTLNSLGTTGTNYAASRQGFRDATINGTINGTNSTIGGQRMHFAAINVTFNGKWNMPGNVGAAGAIGGGAETYVLASTCNWYHTGCGGSAVIARGNHLNYVAEDGIDATQLILSNVVQGQQPSIPGSTATVTNGSTVVTGVTMPGGVPIDSVLTVGEPIDVGSCLPTASGVSNDNIVSIDDVGGTITLTSAATCSATATIGTLGAHPDNVQISNVQTMNNFYLENNNFNYASTASVQGFFTQVKIQGLYAGHNQWKNTGTSILVNVAAIDDGLWDGDSYNGSASYVFTGSFNDFQMLNLKCNAGGSFPSITGANVIKLNGC